MAETNKKKAVNEFNQYVKPVSLWKDAWNRLKKNKMALISLFVISFYILVTMSAQLLTSAGIILSHSDQIIDHQELPPSFKPAGVISIETLIKNRQKFVDSMIERDGQEAVDAYLLELESAVSSEEESGGGFTFDFGAPAEGSDSEAEAGDDFAFAGIDPLKEEIRIYNETIARVESELDTNPLQNRVYILGTDSLGRDMLARIIYGGQISILVGLIGTITAVLIGVIIGSISGYVGGAVDNLLMRFVDILYSLPYMIMVIILMTMIPQSQYRIFIMFIAIAAVSWLTIARVVRGQIISLKNSEFVEAARSVGASTVRIIFRHLMPNTLGVIIIFSTLSIPGFIMNESFLSFLGLGVSAPDASWGTLISEGVQAMQLRPWMLLDPAIAMTIFLFCMNFLGDGLRDALDPQSKNRG